MCSGGDDYDDDVDNYNCEDNDVNSYEFRRQRGRVVWALELKSDEPEIKSRSDNQLDLFQVVPSSPPRLRVYIAN